MVARYLKQLETILAPARARGADIACKHFFGGAAAYLDGRIFMTLTPVGLALKLPRDDRDGLIDQGGKPLRYFPRAPVKKHYVVLPPGLDGEALEDWISRSIAFVGV